MTMACAGVFFVRDESFSCKHSGDFDQSLFCGRNLTLLFLFQKGTYCQIELLTIQLQG